MTRMDSDEIFPVISHSNPCAVTSERTDRTIDRTRGAKTNLKNARGNGRATDDAYIRLGGGRRRSASAKRRERDDARVDERGETTGARTTTNESSLLSFEGKKRKEQQSRWRSSGHNTAARDGRYFSSRGVWLCAHELSTEFVYRTVRLLFLAFRRGRSRV